MLDLPGLHTVARHGDGKRRCAGHPASLCVKKANPRTQARIILQKITCAGERLQCNIPVFADISSLNLMHVIGRDAI